MTLGDRFLVRRDPEGQETYGVVIATRPGFVDLLCPHDEIVSVPYMRGPEIAAAHPVMRRRPFNGQVLPS